MKTEYLYWGSLCLVIYIYAGYPFLLSILSFLSKLLGGARRPSKKEPPKPTVSVVLVVHNEEGRVLERIENLLTADYPGLEEVLVICDRCDDNTGPVAAAATGPIDTGGIGQWVRTVELQKGREGRAAGLNQAVAIAKGDVVVFADIGQRFENDTISLLVAPFVDKKVGAVSGILEDEPLDEEKIKELDVAFELEKMIREKESDIGSTIGCERSVYAVRGDAYEAIREDVILDEVVIPMTIALAGYRVIFEPKAKAHDLTDLGIKGKRARKVHSLAGCWQMLFKFPGWIFPWVNRLTWQLVSHKYLRLFSPVILLTAMVSNIMLLDKSWLYWLFFLGQWFCYGMGAAGLVKFYFPWKPVALLSNVAGAFLSLQAEYIMGLVHWIQGPGDGLEIETAPSDG